MAVYLNFPRDHTNCKPALDQAQKKPLLRARLLCSSHTQIPAPPNYPLKDPKYHLIDTIRPLIEVHCGRQVLRKHTCPNLYRQPLEDPESYRLSTCLISAPNLFKGALFITPSVRVQVPNSKVSTQNHNYDSKHGNLRYPIVRSGALCNSF